MRAALITIVVAGTLGLAPQPGRAATSTSNQDMAALEAKSLELLVSRSYDELDALLESQRSKDARFSDGRPRLMVVYERFTPGARADEGAWRQLRSLVEAWREAKPASPGPHVALAHWWHQYAWKARGGGYATGVTEEGWKGFRERLAKAREVLDESAAVASETPDWNNVLLMVALHSQTPRPEFEKLLESAVAKHPWFLSHWFAAAFYNLDSWYGGPEETEALARKAVERTRDLMGEEMYARVWWVYMGTQGTQAVERGVVDWKPIADAFQVVIEHFPDARNINAFAKFACAAGDVETFLGLLPRIGDRPLMEFWRTPAAYEACRRKAMEGALEL